METPRFCQGNLIHFRIRQLLSQVHPQLLHHRRTFEPSHPKGSTLVMDTPPTTSVRIPQSHILFSPCPLDPRYHPTLFQYD
jgi:hypothetical protein